MVDVPDRTWFDPVLDAWLHTGRNAVLTAATIPPGAALATDIETPGLLDSFTINCVTMAFRDANGRVHGLLLDPRRNDLHIGVAREMFNTAGTIIAHNAPFDVPPLHAAKMLSLDAVNKVVDTALLARFAEPSPLVGKKLEQCAHRHLGMTDFAGGMERAFKAAGFKTIQDGYEGMDIGSPIYRQGAIADTVVTLALEPVLRAACMARSLDHPFSHYGSTDRAAAEAVLERPEVVHRVMLRRSAVGLAVDRTYLDRYTERVYDSRHQAAGVLAQHGLEGGSGKQSGIIAYIDSLGELPAGWPRTKGGKLRATKDDLDGFDHPLAAAQRRLADTDRILGWMEKVARQAEVTGRCHPQVSVLGASATGRMSYGSPELQQFGADARPIICDDRGQGLTSLDWSQIEPVTMANMAGDTGFLEPFEAGADLYEPIQRSAGIVRDTAKVVVLAAMYGQGIASLARDIGHTEESAAQIRRQMFAAMPKCQRWMSKVTDIAATHGQIVTAGGRILPVDAGFDYKAINYTIQGSAADVLMEAIIGMERAGLGDSIHLAMHDEVVVDTDVAAEVQQIMLTPPEFLVRWANRTPVLRTDSNDMGHAWLKV